MESTPSLRDNIRGGRVSVRAGAATIPAIKGLPLLGNMLDFRRNRLALQGRAAALGPLVRLSVGPVALHMISDAALAHEVLVEHADAFEKSRGLSVFLRPLLGDGLLTAKGALHKRQRKLLSQAFVPRRIAGYADAMVAETRTTVDGWRDGARFDAAEAMMEMTLAIAGRTLFDADVRGDAAVVGESLTLAMKAMLAGLSSPLQVPYSWPLPRHQRMRRAVAMLDEVVYRMIAERRAGGGDRGDVLSMLLAARDDEDGTGMSDQQVRDEVTTLLLAGHETTANVLAWTLALLADHPEIRARIEAEVDDVLAGRVASDLDPSAAPRELPAKSRAGRSTDPTARLGMGDLPRLPYTLAVIEESMRLYPPAYTVGRQASREVDIGGFTFARGATLLVSIISIHHRPDYYPEPERFQPERFLGEARKARPRGQYLPFGAGPRVCIGNHFALMEAQLALATICASVRLERTDRRPLVPEPMVTLRPRGGLPMRVVRRRRA